MGKSAILLLPPNYKAGGLHRESINRHQQRMNKALKAGREILIQIIPVAIGVYLGLIVNDWNSNRQAEQRKAQSEELIIQEMKVNRAKVEEALSYHLMLLDSLEGLLQKESPGFKDLGFWNGTRTPRFTMLLINRPPSVVL